MTAPTTPFASSTSVRALGAVLLQPRHAERDDLLRRTHSGGVSVNDWGWHAINHDAPFGGIGNSGIGNYHGEEGFRELSHARTVFQRRRWFPTQLFHRPTAASCSACR
jgi:coniferyl-aldehyde dehydrogenase